MTSLCCELKPENRTEIVMEHIKGPAGVFARILEFLIIVNGDSLSASVLSCVGGFSKAFSIVEEVITGELICWEMGFVYVQGFW